MFLTCERTKGVFGINYLIISIVVSYLLLFVRLFQLLNKLKEKTDKKTPLSKLLSFHTGNSLNFLLYFLDLDS